MKRKLTGLTLAVLLMGAALCGCTEVNEEAVPAANMMTDDPGDMSEFVEAAQAAQAAQRAETETAAAVTETEPPPRERRVSFTALGDNLIHSSIYEQANSRGNGENYDFAAAYAGVADLLDNADITVLNQETLICGDEYGLSTYPCFNSPEDLGEYMAELGVDVFTIANNHTLDKGEDGLRDCLRYYDDHGYVRVGAYIDSEDRADIRTVETEGVVVSFLCYTESLNGLSLSGSTPLQIGRTDDIDVIKEEIRAAREISDICVVSLHWGVEDSDVIQDWQYDYARALGEAGADVIIGNHPHVLRDVEVFENSDGRETICAYSLGNFISAQSKGKNLIGGILNFDVTLGYEGSETPARVENAEFIPIVTHYDSNYSDVRLYKLSDYTPELARAHGVRAYSEFSYEFIENFLSGHRMAPDKTEAAQDMDGADGEAYE